MGCSAQQLSVSEMEKQLWANALVESPSPYLQAHAYDPVRWQPWGATAWRQAQELNQPLLMTVGCLASHQVQAWQADCLQDTLTAELINRYFVPVLIDSEERPDLAYYLQQKARQLGMSQAELPLTALVLPTGEIVQVFTYAHCSAWQQMVHTFGTLYQDDPDAWLELVEQMQWPDSQHLRRSHTPALPWPEATGNLMARMDPVFGGWPQPGQQPMAPAIGYLLRFHARTGDSVSLKKALLTLDQLAFGGIYDHIGGGFFQQTTDVAWRKPRFAKRLSDQAQLVSVFSQAYQITGEPRYAKVIYETLALVEGQLMGDLGGYYAALSATSEGEEGRYYLWPLIEVEALLLDQAELYCRYYHLTQAGNWSPGQSIPYRSLTDREAAAAYGMALPEWQHLIASLDDRMAQARARRLLPTRDQKQIVAWNALMVSAWVDAYRALDDRSFLDRALITADFLRFSCRQAEGELYRYLVQGEGHRAGLLEDYAYLIRAFLDLYRVTLDRGWIDMAKDLMGYAIPRFYRAEQGRFGFQPLGWAELGVPAFRVAQVHRPDLPQPEAVMLRCMQELHQYLDLPSYQRSVRGALLAWERSGYDHLLGQVDWLALQQDEELGRPELLIVDEQAAADLPPWFLQGYWPGYLWLSGDLARQKLQANGQQPGRAPLWFRRRWNEPFQPFDSWEAWGVAQR